MPPVGVAAPALVVAPTAPVELRAAALVVAGAGFNAIGWEFVMFGSATGGAFGGTTFTLMNGALEFAQASAWRLFSKNLSITIALRSLVVRPERRAALRFRTAVPVSTADRFVPSGRTTRLP